MKKFGNILSFGIIAMIALSFTLVFLHTLFNINSIAIQELVIYLHASLFMIGIAYAFIDDKHVRIDIFYQNKTDAQKKKINFLGTLFLLIPFCLFLFYSSYHYVISAWSRLEGSAEPGGIPFVYGLKTLLLIMPILLLVTSIINLRKKH